MNKKIMSFVLATVLTVGLGSSVVFGYSYSKYDSQASSYYSGKTANNSVTVKIGSSDDLLGGNLTAVFGYYAGTLISYQGAGGQFQLYDSYGARFSADNKGGMWNVTGFNARASDVAEMSKYSTAEEYLMSVGFTKESLAVAKTNDKGQAVDKDGKTQSEYISANFKNKDGETLEQVSTSWKQDGEKTNDAGTPVNVAGQTKEEYINSKFDKKDGVMVDANGKTETEISKGWEIATQPIAADWFGTLKSHLASGANFTASISVGSGMTGPTLTVSENGKQMASYQTDPTSGTLRPSATYIYDNKGFMVGIKQYTFEMDSTEDGNAAGHWTQNFTHITYDSKGVRTDTTYQFFEMPDDPIATIKGGSIPQAKVSNDNNTPVVTETTPAVVTAVSHYTANNSMLSSTDFTKGTTTYFANNQASYVLNEKGITVELYKYSANGVIQAHYNANGTDGNGEKVGTTTIFDKWGRQLFTATSGSPDDIFNNPTETARLIGEYNGIINGAQAKAPDFEYKEDTGEGKSGLVAKKDGNGNTGTRISNISIYADQILKKDPSIMGENGFISAKKVSNMISSGNINSIIQNNLSHLGYGGNDLLNALKFSNGGNTALFQTSIAVSTWSGDNIPGDATDTTGGKSTNSKVELTDSKQLAARTRSGGEAKGSFVGTETSSSREKTGTEKYAAGITYNNTVLLGGAQAYSFKQDVITARHTVDIFTTTTTTQDVYSSDPAVEGTLATKAEIEAMGLNPEDVASIEDGFVTMKDGTVYAVVNAESVNLMDGSGFQTAEGEKILVAVGNVNDQNVVNVKDDIKNRIASGNRSIMFMGDVSANPTEDGGYLTMAMNANYSGGYVTGEDIDKTKNTISEISRIAAVYGKDSPECRDAIQKANADGGDWNWVANNTADNLDKFAKGNFTWDNNKSAIKNMKAAWDLLLQF